MSFFLGGLRYREQIYNSTVTQMSACLLSLSVISLVLPVCSLVLSLLACRY
jgi:Ca2+:H+ antiporter